MDKNQRQNIVINNWKNNNYKGGLIAVTGFGKTITAIKAIIECKSNDVIIIVPSVKLKSQWEEVLNNHKLLNITKVIIVNTAYKNNYVCDLLILDEAHLIPAPEFQKCLENVTFNKLLWLTATIERKDGNEEIILSQYPIIDTINLKECLLNNWVSPYEIYNLSVNFNVNDLSDYNKYNNSFRYYAMKCGYGSESFKNATLWLKNGNTEQKQFAAGYYHNMSKRKKIAIENNNKIQVIIDLINYFPDRHGMIFAENTLLPDQISELLPDEVVSIHSKLTIKERKKLEEEFVNNNSNKKWLASAKAYNTGADFPFVSVGILHSYTSSKLVNTQTLGRIIRVQPDKKAVIINLFTPNTVEQSWLKNKQKGLKVNWISNINEIIK